MPGQKRSKPMYGTSSSKEGQKPKATVFRKSAKKQKLDDEKPKPKARPPQRTRPKDQPKPKTKHEFIKAKQDAAKKEKDAATTVKQLEKEQNKKRKQNVKAKEHALASAPATLLIRPPKPTSCFKIVAGSYERLLYGLQATVSQSSSSSSSSSSCHSSFSVQLQPFFTFPAHVSSIKTVATAGPDSKWLATGGADEVVKVWDIRKQREVGQLTGHQGTITSLVFASRTYLMTTSADSHINLYRTRDWALLRTLKGHIGRINSAAPHPTGRLALSVGSDRTIRMWDLMRGRPAASTKIGIEADLVRWDTKGTRFAVIAYRQAMVFKTDMTKVAELEDNRRIADLQFVTVKGPDGKDHELLFTALEEGVVKVFDLDAKVKQEEEKTKEDEEEEAEAEEKQQDLTPLVEVARLVGHKNRVKAVSILPVLVPQNEEASNGKGKDKATGKTFQAYAATTVSSDGFIRVFDLSEIISNLSPQSSEKTLAEYEQSKVEIESVAEYNTRGTRLTCLTTVGISENLDSKHDENDEELIASDDEQERDDVDVDDEEEEEEDEDEEDIIVDEKEEEEELKRLEEAIKQAQAKGLKMEDLEALMEYFENGDEDDEDGDDEEDEDEVESEEEGEDEDEDEDDE